MSIKEILKEAVNVVDIGALSSTGNGEERPLLLLVCHDGKSNQFFRYGGKDPMSIYPFIEGETPNMRDMYASIIYESGKASVKRGFIDTIDVNGNLFHVTPNLYPLIPKPIQKHFCLDGH